MTKKPYAIIIRDGFGCNPKNQSNAIAAAKTPNHDAYIQKYPTGLIGTSGEVVGLPENTMGSSEVGHLNIGAGRIVFQSLARINKSIREGDFNKINVLNKTIDKIKANNGKLHLMGLIQDAGVHAHTSHCIETLKLAKARGLTSEQCLIHVFSDGRDTAPQSAKTHVKVLSDFIEESQFGKIVTLCGRFFSMDRDNRWERVEKSYRLIAEAKSEFDSFDNVQAAIDDAYAKDETDEFILPRLIDNDYTGVNNGDAIFFFNFRFDRTREISKAFILDGFDDFKPKPLSDLSYLCMTNYYDGIDQSTRADVNVAFLPIPMSNILGEFLANQGKTQLRIAETEKFPHVTFFFNGQTDVVYDGESRIGPPSPKVETYDLQPEMSAAEVTDNVIKEIKSGKHDVIILNFANPDMVGHTGVFDAVVKSVEVVDACVGKVIDAILEADGTALLTADHGNCEQMTDYDTGGPMTAHTLFDVWVSLISSRDDLQNSAITIAEGGKLGDLAPTLLNIMGMEQPAEMTGQNLIAPKTATV